MRRTGADWPPSYIRALARSAVRLGHSRDTFIHGVKPGYIEAMNAAFKEAMDAAFTIELQAAMKEINQ